MTGAMTGRNRAIGREFRESVAEFLRTAGHQDAKANNPIRLSDAILLPGDIDGIENWVVSVRSGKTLDLAGIVKEAECAARVHGKDFAVGVHRRRGCGPEDAYAAMSLNALARIIHLLEANEDEPTV